MPKTPKVDDDAARDIAAAAPPLTAEQITVLRRAFASARPQQHLTETEVRDGRTQKDPPLEGLLHDVHDLDQG